MRNDEQCTTHIARGQNGQAAGSKYASLSVMQRSYNGRLATALADGCLSALLGRTSTARRPAIRTNQSDKGPRREARPWHHSISAP
jgi:hypothetical protein